jgi:beta-lactamase regulating signal transducer with metallopeptidase domain
MNILNLASTLFQKIQESTLSASILAILVLILQLILKKKLTATWRFALWIPVLIRLLVPVLPESSFSLFNAPRWFHFANPGIPQVTVEIKNNNIPFQLAPESSLIPLEEPPTPFPQFKKPPVTLLQKLSLLWLLGSIALILRLLIGTLWLNFRLRKNHSFPSPTLFRIFLSTCRETQTAWKPRLIETSLVESPGLFGFLRPTLLLPRGIESHLTESQLRHIFLHELAHLKRGDLISNSFMALAQAIHWFNPIVWLLLRRMRLERELACDALALRFTESEGPRPYGETILKLLDQVNSRLPLPAMVGILEEKLTAKSRLEQIAIFKNQSTWTKLGLPLLFATILFGLSNAQTESPAKTTASRNDQTATSTEDKIIDQGAVAHIEGIAALEKEYAKQKNVVAEAQKTLHEVGLRLGVSEIPPGGGEPVVTRCCGAEEDKIERMKNNQALLTSLNSLLQQLNGKSQDEIRKIIPAALPNPKLDQLIADLHKNEQQRAALALDYTASHPDLQRLNAVAKTIDNQINEEIDRTMLGLKTKATQARVIIESYKANVEERKKDENEKRTFYQPYFAARHDLENQQKALDTIQKRLLSEKLESKVSTDYTGLIQDARLLIEMKRFDEADLKLKAALTNDPDSRLAQYYLAQIKKLRGASTDPIEREIPPPMKTDVIEAMLSPQNSDKPQSLYTRTFKVNPALFLENIQRLHSSKSLTPQNEKSTDTNRIQILIRNYFESIGVNFSTNNLAEANGQPVATSQKAIFFNDRTGVLFARAPLVDLDKIETALHTLNSKTQEIEYYCRIISLPNEAGQEFIKKWSNNPGYSGNAIATITSVMNDDQLKQTVESLKQGSNTVSISNRTVTITGLMTDPQFSNVVASIAGITNKTTNTSGAPDATHVFNSETDLMDAAEKIKGSQVLGGVSLLAFTGQTALIKVAAGPKMEVTGTYDSEKQLHQIRAEVTIPEGEEKITFSAYGAVHGGEAFVFAKKAKLSEEKELPVLSEIPTLGRLFRSTTPPEEKTILFFIVPKLHLMDEISKPIISDNAR